MNEKIPVETKTTAFLLIPAATAEMIPEAVEELQNGEISRQKAEIGEFCKDTVIVVDGFTTSTVSLCRIIANITDEFQEGDCIVVSTITHLGESLKEVVQTTDRLIEAGIRLIACREEIDLRTDTAANKATARLLRCLSHIPKSILKRRVAFGLAVRRAQGRRIGRPRGIPGKSSLDGRKDEIVKYLKHNVPKAAIARLLKVNRATLFNYLKVHKAELDGQLAGEEGASSIASPGRKTALGGK